MNGIAITLIGLALSAPPASMPPKGPLYRSDPKVYDVRFEVTVNTEILGHRYRTLFDLSDTPIVMPLVFQGAYSQIHDDSVWANLWLDSRADRGLADRFRIEGDDTIGDGYPHHTHLAVLPIAHFRGQSLRWSIGYRVQSWSCRIDDNLAAQIPWPRQWPRELIDDSNPPRPWPRQWPAEVADALKPQMFIESDALLFTEEVARVDKQFNLRMMTPFMAAKVLLRNSLSRVRITSNGTHWLVIDSRWWTYNQHPFFRPGASPDGQHRIRPQQIPMIKGLKVNGAAAAVRSGMGSPHDLVCVCVATLRAAGIPARAVIGTQEGTKKRRIGGGAAEIISWAEFYLPGAGWVSFDPAEMAGQAIMNRNLHDPWPEFGTMKDLNLRIPLAYHFIPPREVESPQHPAIWGWSPGPLGVPDTTEQWIYVGIASLGRGVDDPQ